MKRSPMKPRRTRLRARNPARALSKWAYEDGRPVRRQKRKPSEFARIYGSRKRVAWVKSLPCTVGGCVARDIDNAHTEGGGVGRKADADRIIPLCRYHHDELHQIGAASFADLYWLDLSDEADVIAALWLEIQA